MNEQDFYAQLPRKKMATGVLFFQDQSLLLVKPTYKDGWSIPGGIVEQAVLTK